jgi:single-stranded DNA-binding protein
MSINDVQESGGLTRDPTFSFLEGSGAAMWRATIAVNDTRYNSETRSQEVDTIYVSLICFGSKAEEFHELNLIQGEEIFVRGALSQKAIPGVAKEETKTRVKIWHLEVLRRRQAAPPGTGWGPNQKEEPPF